MPIVLLKQNEPAAATEQDEMNNNELMLAMIAAWNAKDMSTYSTLCKEAALRDLVEWSEE